jgi:intracellular sulfur oxidation DsrE/DsrF family protein
MEELNKVNSRRQFMGKLASGTAAGILTFTNPFAPTVAYGKTDWRDSEDWFKLAKGRHRIVYDASEPHQGLPLIWTWVFYHTNNNTGTTDKDMTGMVILRHNAIPFAMEDRLWKKYNLGEVFKITDNTTQQSALRNPYYEPKEGDYPFPGIDGIKRMQERGAMFCVCDMALTVYSGVIAKKNNLSAEEVKKDWVAGVHKNIQIVPSGVWAVGRAQENGFAYCYAGG